MLEIRRMRPEDKPGLLAIASRIWEGGDYLASVFDEWVADSRGEFAAVLLNGAVVGCGKLTFLTDTDAWLEGLRKDPRVTETGLGRAVAHHFLSLLARRTDLTSIRFVTYVKNLASITTTEHLGFRVRTALSFKVWHGSRIELETALRERRSRVAPRTDVRLISDEAAILDFLSRSGYFAATQSLIAEGWRVFPYSAARFVERYAREGLCRGVYRQEGLAGLAAWKIERRPGRTGVKVICLDAADDETAGALLDDVFRRLYEASDGGGGESQTFDVEWMLPPGERFRTWCVGRGLASWEQENDFLVYELPLDLLTRFENAGGTRA